MTAPAGSDSVTAPEPFDLGGPLPAPGVTVLEASAGTGKTFTIAALVARFVAAGTPLSEMLAVTFTRMATGELRDRVRDRLASAEEGLGRLLDLGEQPGGSDEVLALLADGPEAEVGLRRQRLAAAVSSFDEATITTTHGFCQLMLAGLGVAGDVATGASFLEDPSDLVEEVVDDLYVRWALRHSGPPPFGRSDALRIADAAVANRDTPLQPDPGDDAGGLRRRIADGARKEVERRLVEANLLTYDDLLVRLSATLRHPTRGEAACQRLRSRYSVVLVDEFQDTDPVQWDVVRTAFGTGTTVLVLIGDPKQAIYAFRGADVYSYLEAGRLADRRYSLDVNWRSDAGLLEAFDAFLDPLRLGHPDIAYRRVRAAGCHRGPGLDGAPARAELRTRVLHQKDHRLPMTKSGDIRKAEAVAAVAADVAADVATLLGSRAAVLERDDDGSERARRDLVPGDVAVLVKTNRQATIVQQALRAANVPAVVAGAESVFETPAARHWLSLLEAIEQPASPPRAVAVALTPFIGMTADEVSGATDADWEDVHARLHRWGDVLRGGVASLFRAVVAGEGMPRRLLSEREGERELTDLGHIAQLLHAEASRGQLGPSALRAWLKRRLDDVASDSADAEERSRRLDSDAEAVQVLTVHRAKGLEFPIVYCPFLWDVGMVARSGRPVVYHDPDAGNRRTLDVAGDGTDYQRHFNLQRDEERGEALRQLYVALTRAQHQVVVWWAKVNDCEHSPLGRLLFGREPDGTVAVSGRRAPKDDDVQVRLEELARRAPGRISVERVGTPDDEQWEGVTDREGGTLEAAAFDRSIDVSWRRSSYSAITAGLHGDAVGSEPEEPGTNDEPATAETGKAAGAAASAPLAATLRPGTTAGADGGGETEASAEEAARAVACPLATVPGGVETGTFVHRVFELVDFAAPDLAAELSEVVAEQLRYRPAVGSAEALVAGLEAAISTPLGPLAGDGGPLRAVARGDRLDELGFELPVAGGERAGGAAVTTADIARLFAEHEETGGPLAGYAERLRDPLLSAELRGYLTGSLDLVFRRHSAGGGRQYYVVDYKTNWLGRTEAPLSAWDYRPAALDAEMQRMHYPLQAIFYSVALHRYLRWRLAGYTPETHLGGVLYLFVRGMVGPATPLVDGVPCGVFGWRPVPSLVVGLSDLLDSGSPTVRRRRRS